MEKTTSQRTLSKKKLDMFISAAEKRIKEEYRPDIIIQSKELASYLKKGNIQLNAMSRFGCPCHYVKTFAKLCDSDNPKSTYSKQCMECWFMALTSYIEETKEEIQEIDPYIFTKEELAYLLKKAGYNPVKEKEEFLESIGFAK